MKTLLITLAISSLTLLAKSQTNSLTTENFSKIEIDGNARIALKQDATFSIVYGGNDNASHADVSIKNDKLIIGGSAGEEMTVTLPVLSEISIDGNGSVNGLSTFAADHLKLSISGDGKISLAINTKNTEAKISGIGKITLTGSSDYASYSIPGSGKIDAAGLKTINTETKISGIGKCLVNVSDTLDIDIEGNGSVTYESLPKYVNKNITGIGNINGNEVANSGVCIKPDTTKLLFGKNEVWFIGKKDSLHSKRNKVRPIWAGLELGLNSYLDNGGEFTLNKSKENFELQVEKSVSVSLNLLQAEIEIGHSNIWLFTGLGVTWNNYRFDNDIVLEKGPYIGAHKDTTPGVNHIKSKLVASYLMAPVMLEVFSSRNEKKAFHIGAGALLGVRIGSHTKQKIEVDGETTKLKDFDSYNLNPFRYGFRVSIGYGKFNLFADYYASTVFKENKGPVLYPVNAGITMVGF